MMTLRRFSALAAGLFLSFGLAAPARGRQGAASQKTTAPTSAPSPATGKQTFGRAPCGRLVAIEEIEAAFRTEIVMINVVAEGTCLYENKARQPVLSVKLTSGPGLRCAAQDGTYMGSPAEPVAGVGDAAAWSRSAGTLCFTKGNERVQLSFGSAPPEGRDPKTVLAELARKAVPRLGAPAPGR